MLGLHVDLEVVWPGESMPKEAAAMDVASAVSALGTLMLLTTMLTYSTALAVLAHALVAAVLANGAAPTLLALTLQAAMLADTAAPAIIAMLLLAAMLA